MSAPFYTTLVTDLLQKADHFVTSYVYAGYHSLALFVGVPVGLVTALYLVVLGVGIALGSVKVDVRTFTKSCIKIGIIYTVIFNWSFISYYFIGLVNAMIGGAGDALIAANPFHLPASGGLNGAMQATLNDFIQIGNSLFSIGGIHNIGALIDGVIILGFGMLIVGIGLLELILAKVMLAILFVFTPLMVFGTYFQWGQSVFYRWFQAIIGMGLMQLFVVAALVFAITLSYAWIAPQLTHPALNIGNIGTLPLVILGILSLALVIKAALLAQNLGGVVASSAATAMLAGMIGYAVGNAVKAAMLVAGPAGLAMTGARLAAKGGLKAGKFMTGLKDKK